MYDMFILYLVFSKNLGVNAGAHVYDDISAPF